jgi:hypothetical protein
MVGIGDFIVFFTYLFIFQAHEVLLKIMEDRAGLVCLNPISVSYHRPYSAAAALLFIARRQGPRLFIWSGVIAGLSRHLLIASGSRGPFVAMLAVERR